VPVEPAAGGALSAPGDPLDAVAAAVADVGVALLGQGTSSYRVRRAVLRVAAALGCDDATVLVTLKAVVVTVTRGGEHRTVVRGVGALHVDTNHLDQLERLVRELPDGASATAVREAVTTVLAEPRRYRRTFVVLAVGLACAGFAGLNAGGAVEILAAFLGASAGQALRFALLRARVNPLAVVAAAAFVAASVYLLSVAGLEAVGAAVPGNEAGFVSATLFLVPGFPLVSGILDLLRGEPESAVARLAYAGTVFTMAGIGLLVVATVAALELPSRGATALELSGWFGVVALTVASAAGFAVLFNAPPRMVGLACVAAVAGNVARLALLDAEALAAVAAFLGAVVVGLVVAVAAPWAQYTRIVLAIPGVIVMIPGTAAYSGLVLLSRGDLIAALERGVEAILVVGALGLGLAVARMLTDAEWAFERT
jgi:uncharacterized membrane protein YjjP (DUF1212 family)